MDKVSFVKKEKFLYILSICLVFTILSIYFASSFFKAFAYDEESEGQNITYAMDYKNSKLNGWILEENNWYYYIDGERQTGWINDGNNKYYLKEDARMAQYWQMLDGGWYYFGQDGAMKTGWINDGDWYYLNENGIMQTGWIEDNGNRYYLTDSGKMAQYWYLLDYWYYFGQDGAMRTGWLNFENGDQYYLNRSGIMLTNWNVIGDEWHYFRPNGLYQKNWKRDDTGGTITTSSGEVINYKSVIRATCTAYTADKGALTSTGVEAQYGYVAVNPYDIGYGSQLYICSPDGSINYGKAVAADTGGAMMNGSVAVDLFFNTYDECIQFGRREMLIYLI